MKKVILVSVMAVATANAGVYIGGNVGVQKMNGNASTTNVTRTIGGNTTSGADTKFKSAKTFLIGGVFVGYDHWMSKVGVGVESSFDLMNHTSSKTIDMRSVDITNARVAGSDLNTPCPLTVQVKSTYGFGIMPKIMGKVSDKFDLGFGVKLNWTRFSISAIASEDPTNWADAHKKTMFGYEPTIFGSYAICDKLSLRLSMGMAKYRQIKTSDLTAVSSITASVKIKPKSYNAKMAAIYKF
jgi:hypothetical protein